MLNNEKTEYIERLEKLLICEDGSFCMKQFVSNVMCKKCGKSLNLCEDHKQEIDKAGECWYCTKGI